ncbi:hypothetical protein Tco_0781962 [Tanacetum coccineum]
MIRLKVMYVMSTHISGLLEDDTLEAVRHITVWENDDYICIGHILNGISNSMFDIYQMVDSTNELSDSIESRYMADDASSKKFLISNFNNYKMVNSRPVIEQFNELLRILGQYSQHNLKMDESMYVSSVIDKLPPSWKDFKHSLKHGGWSVGEYLSLKDDGYVDTLECLGYPMPQEPSVSLILNSLSKDYEQFVQIYNMHSMMKTIVKLHFMLKLTEEGILIKADTIKEAIKAIGNFDLVLHIGLIIALHNCDYSPSIIRGVVSLSRLVDNGYIHTFTNYGISVSKDDVTMSIEGASYFITVTDDFSCYGQGCEELVKRDTPGKLKFRSIKCIFVGYLKETMGYYFNNLERNKILVARYAEKQLGAISNRIPQAPDRYGFYVDAKEHELGDLNEPPNYKVALLDPKSDKWVEAMNAKMQSLKDNQVWCLVDLPHDGRTIGSKCPFKKIPIWMAKYILLKLVLWEKIIPKPIGQIMRELSLLLYTLEL